MRSDASGPRRRWPTEKRSVGRCHLVRCCALVGFVFLRRRWSARHVPAALPRSVVDAVAFTVFGAAGVWLGALGIDALAMSSGRGAGQGLGTAPAMILLAAAFGLRLVQDLRDPSVGRPTTAN
jgi:hypothetical protein